MPTYPLDTLAATVTPAGISSPPYSDILSSLIASLKIIHGDDAYLEPDSQDGQLLAIVARAIHDANMTAIAVYNVFSPQTSSGNALSSVVKINNIARLPATNSQANLTITGVVGTTITAGIAADESGNRWLLPASVVIPPGGTIVVTATAETSGPVAAAATTITAIMTPVSGWTGVTNLSAATLGSAVESDAALRARQASVPALNSVSSIQSLSAALKALPGVSYGIIYDNDGTTTDANGIPAHSIAVVVKGGTLSGVVAAIFAKKPPGTSTHGSTSGTIVDSAGVTRTINFTIPTESTVDVAIAITGSVGYTSSIGDRIKQAVADHINAQTIGETLVVNRLYGPALLNGDPSSLAYKITALQARVSPAALGTSDISFGYSAKAVCTPADVVLTVT